MFKRFTRDLLNLIIAEEEKYKQDLEKSLEYNLKPYQLKWHVKEVWWELYVQCKEFQFK